MKRPVKVVASKPKDPEDPLRELQKKYGGTISGCGYAATLTLTPSEMSPIQKEMFYQDFKINHMQLPEVKCQNQR